MVDVIQGAATRRFAAACLALVWAACGRIDYLAQHDVDATVNDSGMHVDAGAADARAADAGSIDAGSVDASSTGAAPVPRVISSVYWTNWFGPVFGTTGMSQTGFEIGTSGVEDGELLLLIGCIDNGSTTVWPVPLSAGFTQLSQDFWGSDGQTCVVDWKIAASEPATYTGTYGPGIVSASAVLVLIAVAGAASTNPIADFARTTGMPPDVNPALADSPGVTTTVSNSLVLYAAESDWICYFASTIAFTVPTGFTTLLQLSDQGTLVRDWTAMQLEHQTQATPGATGPISSTQTSTPDCGATAWTAAFAISPR